MKNKKVLFRILSIITLLFYFCACNNFNDPEKILNPINAVEPTISGIDPTDSALAGINGREITILGTNFSADPNLNSVYFDKQPALIKSSTQNQIEVYRPAIYGDSLTVEVTTNPAAYTIVTYDKKYKIERPFYPYISETVSQYFAMDIDENENLYIGSKQVIYQIQPAVDTIMIYKNLAKDFIKITDLKLGPDGYLYILASKNNVYRVSASTESETYVTLTSVTEKMDFDQNQNIYTGYKNGIDVIKADKSVNSSGLYAGVFTIKGIRVYNGAVYTNAAYTGKDTLFTSKEAIWKNSILDANGTLDTLKQIVFDLSNYADPLLNTCVISSFDFDANGTLYLILTKKNVYLSHYLYVLENGILVPFYRDNILPKRLDHIVWGSQQLAYVNRGFTVMSADSIHVLRMNMGIEGAPYYGR